MRGGKKLNSLSVPSIPITKKEECFSHAEFGYKAMDYDSTTESFICCTQRSEGGRGEVKKATQKTVDQLINECLLFRFDLKG